MPSQDSYKRVNRGYKLREDLIKACKKLALDEDKPLYKVMEDALEEYLERRTANSNVMTSSRSSPSGGISIGPSDPDPST